MWARILLSTFMVEGLVATDPFVGGNTGGYHRQDRWGQMLAPGLHLARGGGAVDRLDQTKEIVKI